MFEKNIYPNRAGVLRALMINMKVRRQSVNFIAGKLGISEQHLYRIMSGQRNPSVGLLAAWAKLYNRELIATYRLERTPMSEATQRAEE